MSTLIEVTVVHGGATVLREVTAEIGVAKLRCSLLAAAWPTEPRLTSTRTASVIAPSSDRDLLSR